jgi:hypothetical protein
MKISSAGCLLFVAIVTSAVVAQIRVHTLPSNQTGMPAHTHTSAAPQTSRLPSCENGRDAILRASCEMRGARGPIENSDRSINGIDTPHASKLWV